MKKIKAEYATKLCDFSQTALEVFLNALLKESTSEYPSSDANAKSERY